MNFSSRKEVSRKEISRKARKGAKNAKKNFKKRHGINLVYSIEDTQLTQ